MTRYLGVATDDMSGVLLREQLASQDIESSGAARVGYDGETVEQALDKAKAFPSYAELRAYQGMAEVIHITNPGVEGFFVEAAAVTPVDNGGTRIVDAIGRAWDRIFKGSAIPQWFGALGNGVADDSGALNSAIAFCLANGVDLRLPGGRYLLSSQLNAANGSLTISGDGIGITKLIVTHDQKGFSYSTTDRTNNLKISSLEVISTNSASITGIDITFPVTTAVDQTQLTMTDVTVRISGSGAWNYACVRLEGVKNPMLERVIARGLINTTLYGISLEGQTIDSDLNACRAYLVGAGIYITGANEGAVIRGFTAVSVKRGIDLNPDNGGPWASISNFHINSSEIGIRCNRRTQVEINNGLLYANHLFGSDSWTGISIEHNSGQFAEYCNVEHVTFNRQNYVNPTVGISYTNARNCNAEYCSFVNIASPFVEDATSTGILKFNNQYPGISNPVTKNGVSAGETLRIDTGLAQNRTFIAGAATGISPTFGVEGVDTTINMNIQAKGANGLVTLGSTVGTGFQVLTPASTANRVRAVGATAGNPATIDATGSDAIIWIALRGKSTGGITLPTGIALNFANDTAAAAGGVPVGGVYHTSGALKIRLT